MIYKVKIEGFAYVDAKSDEEAKDLYIDGEYMFRTLAPTKAEKSTITDMMTNTMEDTEDTQ